MLSKDNVSFEMPESEIVELPTGGIEKESGNCGVELSIWNFGIAWNFTILESDVSFETGQLSRNSRIKLKDILARRKCPC